MGGSGWIKVWRSSLENGWLRNHKLWAFWCYCLLKASHKEHKVMIGRQQITLQPGQFVFGRRVASQDTKLTEQQIRTALATLERLGNITVRTTNKYSVLTVVNWAFYQTHDEKITHSLNDPQPSKDHIQELENGISDNEKKEKREGSEQVHPSLSFSLYKEKVKGTDQEVTLDADNVITYYLRKYKIYRGEVHPSLRPEQWQQIINGIFNIGGDECLKWEALDPEALRVMIDQHFETTYQDGCDYRLMHFCSDGIRQRRFYETCY